MNLKKIIAVTALAVMCTALAGCGKDSGNSSKAPAAAASAAASDTASLSDKTAALKDSITLPEMVAIKSETLKDRYGIDESDVADFSAYICGSGAMPDEFGIFRANDADAASRIAERLNKRVEQQRKTFKDYTPNEMYKFDDCFVDTSGTTVSYAICEDNSKAKSLFK